MNSSDKVSAGYRQAPASQGFGGRGFEAVVGWDAAFS
jgi:hypothetical protein